MGKIGENSGITPISAGRRRCPICGKPAAARHQPFCSTRCADIDLGRWLKDSYRVETDEGPDAEGDDDSGNS